MNNYRRHHKSQAAKSTGQQQEAPLAAGHWQDGQPGMQFGAVWVLLGLASYLTLSVLARAALHSPKALQQHQQQVPSYIYDRSLFVFGTAFLLDVLGLLFELKSSRLDVVLLPAFVKGAATLTNSLMRSGWATVAFSTSGKVVVVQRFLCWLHTTPTILVLVKMMATNITRQQAVRAILFVEVMVVTGLLGSFTTGWWAVFWGGLSHLAFLPILPYLHQGLKEAAAVVSLHAARPTMSIVYYLTMLMWTGFGVVWDLRLLGLIDTRTEEVAYLCCDFSAKVMFSAGLMLSSFKGLDSRREVVMRQIQEAHKQTLILELKRAIEQKDAFMSSVSHELRTPLNGIIGISEGLLANCCGPLSESVRKQLFIVRTSGARLLALINDVMDAATLRQHRLVLKQERLELRQVVGDVVDLTRSLVDADVSLRNDVPEGLEVWADSGRIIQILNNLLGNAAKFTHQGYIRVSAKWHDEQRQWVVIQVTDTGIGIPKQKLQSIFLPFEQVDGSISRQYGGFGLGLSITQELVKAHGGELWVKSRAHKGSQFAFTIASYTGQKPLTQQQQQQLQLQSRRSTPLARSTAAVDAVRRRSSSRALTPPVSPPAAAAAAEDGGCNGITAAADKHPASALNGDASAAVAGLAGLNCVEPLPMIAHSALTEDLLDSCVGADYATELPYDAAQLSALASSKPFTSNHTASSSGSGSLQRVGSGALHHASSMLSLSAAVDGDGMDITPVPNRDQRPSQFACTGRYQVLSVDDDPVNQTVVQSLLASTGYEVVCLYNGQQTLEYIESADVLPDVILLDMLMPDMSGPDVCRQLALRQPPLGVPIILVSALAEESSVVTGLDSGADDYITKPFRRAEFLARIRGKLQLAAAEQARQVSAPFAGGAGGQACVVMCVTDDEVNHIVLEGILQSQNYRYQKVSSGAEALKLLEASGSTPPHLVLLDAALPDTTGLDVLQTLRQQFSQVALPVIMLTARHNEKSIVQALDAGANDYAVKPFRRSELLARIRMHLRSSQKAAAVVSPAARHSAELSFAGDFDEERMSAELQRGVRLQQLSTVPLLVIQLGGVSDVLAGASAEQACQLMGFIADCFDAVVEKYAVIKVEASDTSLTVAAPLSTGSNQNSARNSFQLPPMQLSTAGNSNTSIMFQARAADGTAGLTWDAAQQQMPYEAAAAAAAAGEPAPCAAGAPFARPASALAVAMLQLLQMAQELQAHLGVDCAPSSQGSSSTGSSTPSDAADVHSRPTSPQLQPASSLAQPSGQQQAGAEGGSRARPRTPLQLMQPQAPQWWHGQLQVHMSLHVGPLTAGVVGRRRPRYRLIGPALQVARQACEQAPANRTAVTADAARLLHDSGVDSLKRLAGGTVATGGSERQLWVLNAGAAVPALQHLAAGSLRAGAAAGVSTDGVLNQAAAALAGTAGKGFGAPLMHIGSVDVAAYVSSGSNADAGAPFGVSTAAGSMQQPRSTLPPQQQQQQQQQQQHMGVSTGVAAAVAGQAPYGRLPALPPLPDLALQASQQLLMQELGLLAQQLSAACMPGLLGPLSSGMQTSWSQPAQCLPLNGQLGPVVSSVNQDSKVVSHPAAGLQEAAPVVSAVVPDAAVLPAAAACAEVVSASLSLHDWQGSPKQASAQQLPVRSSTDVQDCCTPAAVDGNAAAGTNCVLADTAGAGSCGLQLSEAAGFPAGVQLGPAEMQQISMLQHELATLQQQITSALAVGGMTNGFVSGMSQYLPGYGPALQQQPMLQQYGTNHHVQHSTGGASSADGSSSLLGRRCSISASDAPAVAAAAAAGHGVHCSSGCSGRRSSGAGSSCAVESRQSDSNATVAGEQLLNSGSKGRQFFGQLLSRRRSSKTKKQQQQQLD